MISIRGEVNDEGRLEIPAELLAAAGIGTNANVILRVVRPGHIEVLTPEASIAAAQEIVRQHATNRSGVVDDLLAQRRREAGSA